MRRLIAATTALLVTAVCSAASAQTIVYETYSPVMTEVVTPAPVVVQSPVVQSPVVQAPVVYDAWRPIVRSYNYRPPVSSPSFTDYTSNYGNYGATTSYYAPVTTYSPVVTSTYSPVVTSTYSPVVTTYSPVVTTYSPVVTSYYSPVVVRPRYVAGQPVRNFFRSMGP
jgi:hypothetical protein